MFKNYSRTFEQLEKSKEGLLRNLADENPQQIAIRKNNKWSPIEHCYHVYLAEKLSRKYCIKKLSFNHELKDAGFKNQFRIWALMTIEWMPIKFKAPKAIDEQVFPENLDLNLVREGWTKDRQELKSFLTNLDPSYINKEIYKQPSVGRLTIGGMLQFFQFHLNRHRSHIRRDYGIG